MTVRHVHGSSLPIIRSHIVKGTLMSPGAFLTPSTRTLGSNPSRCAFAPSFHSRKAALCGGVLSIRASMHLDGEVHEIIVVREEAFVVVRALRSVSDEDNNRGEVTRPDPPDVQVGDTIVCVALDRLGNRGATSFSDLGIEQNPARISKQSE